MSVEQKLSGYMSVPAWSIGLLVTMMIGAYAFIFTGITSQMQAITNDQTAMNQRLNIEAQARIAMTGTIETVNFRLARIENTVDRIDQRTSAR